MDPVEVINNITIIIIIIVIFVLIPLVPIMLLWWFLLPATFWEKLVFLIISVLVYLIIVSIEVAML